ncbi:MAG: tRNA 4-thiouridine(8) synthase ThiI [Candidatus Aenigmarchaeota archaeon]|nr:tRNA 4-thiouridine(8) synthase ThiI [Candidatus Aenigmarchaeota archaeon]
MTKKIIVKYGELWLKSPHIRNEFAKKLRRNVKSMLTMANVEFEILRERDRILITTEKVDEAVEVLKRAFGVSQLIVSEEVDNDFEDIKAKALELAKNIGENETFAIRAKRKNKKYPMDSIEIEKGIAEDIDRKVDLTNPDKVIYVVVRGQTADIFTDKMKGEGGLPIGVSGRMLCLVSAGIDSPVAAWMMMKRGAIVDFITLYDEKPNPATRKLLEQLKTYSPREMRLYQVKYGEIQKELQRWAKKYTCVFCKRFMYKIAQEIAKENKYNALVTGENLSQVASQTIQNLTTQQRGLEIPVIRPLIGLEKTDIMAMAERIGTFGISEKGRAKCHYVPESPATKSDDDDIFHVEKMMDVAKIIKDAAERAEMEMV